MKKSLLSLTFIATALFAFAQEPVVIGQYPTIYEFNDDPILDAGKGEKREFNDYYKRRTGMQVDSVILTISNIKVKVKPTSTNYLFWKEVGNMYPFWGQARVLGCRIGYNKYKKNDRADTYDLSLYGTSSSSAKLPDEILAVRSFSGDEIRTGTDVDSFTYIKFKGSDFTEVTTPFALTVALEDVTPFADSSDIVEVYSSLKGDGNSEERAIVKVTAESIFWAGIEFYKMDRMFRDNTGNFYNFDYDIMMIPVVDVEAGVDYAIMNGFQFNGHFPNPAKNSITFDLDVNESMDNFNVRVTTIGGKTVKTFNTGKLNTGKQLVKMDVSSLSAGTYIYTINNGKSALSSELIIVE